MEKNDNIDFSLETTILVRIVSNILANLMAVNTVFGIHIGNTNFSLAICKEGQPEIIVNDAGERITPAIVTFTINEVIVGAEAKTGMTSRWKTTIANNKSLFDMEQNEVDKMSHYNHLEVVMKNGEIHYCLPLDKSIKHVTPETVLTSILKNLHTSAKTSINVIDPSKGLLCVLLATEKVSDEACNKYKTAAESAGWKVLQIINKTAAAVLAYSLLEKKEPSQTVLVYRVGGTTCEAAVYESSDGMLYFLGSEHRANTGADNFTQILTDFLVEEFYKKCKLNAKENRKSIGKLQLAAENCVHGLTRLETVTCFVESLQDGVDFHLTITRGRFDLLIQPILTKFTEPVKLLLERLNLCEPVDKVVLCGGASGVPKLKSHIVNLFGTDVTEILSHLNGSEVLALGAAKQAYCLLTNDVTELLPRSLEIIVKNEENYVTYDF